MSGWVTVCSRLYRRAACTFPHEFRAVCGDGLERLGEDVVPLVWQQQGTVGMIRLFADLAVRLPYEYLSTWIRKAKELTMTDDVFEGTWTAKSEDSQWDVRGNPKPQQACLRFEATETGYLIVAYGIVEGKAVAERPQAISTDGRRRPLLDLNSRPIPGVPPGALTFGRRSDSQTLEIGAEDGLPPRRRVGRNTLRDHTGGIFERHSARASSNWCKRLRMTYRRQPGGRLY